MCYLFVFYVLFGLLYSCAVLAFGGNEGVGAIANDIQQPISLIIQLVRAVSAICGFGLTLGGILKFLEHRRNPVAVTLSAVFFMFLFGFALISVALIPMYINMT
jgi:hypothetical protein